MQSPILHMFGDRHPVICRNPHTHDFPIYRVTLTLTQATTIVMQYGSDDDLKAYVSPQTTEARKVDVVMACLASSMGKPLFLTLPATPLAPPAMRSAVLLALDNRTSDPLVLALCHVISNPCQQGGDFVLRHAGMAATDHHTVMQAYVQLLPSRAMTLAESLAKEVPLDAVYSLGADARAILAGSIPFLMDWYYAGTEAKDHHVRVYTTNTTNAGYVSRQQAPSLVLDFLLAAQGPRCPVSRTRLSSLVEPVRAVLLARVLGNALMATDSAFYLFCAIERGSWVDSTGCEINRLTSYEDFREAMRARQHVGTP